MFKILAAAALVASSFAASASVNLVQDGSFESTLIGAGSWTTVGSTTGWSSTNGIEIRNAVAGTAYAGSNFAELDTNQNSSISQSLDTIAGNHYLLTFWVQDRAGDVADTDGISYAIDGVGASIAGGDAAWTEYSYAFVATGASTVLTFNAGGTSNGYGSSLDNINVSVVPEANSFMMLAAGLGLLGLARRRAAK